MRVVLSLLALTLVLVSCTSSDSATLTLEANVVVREGETFTLRALAPAGTEKVSFYLDDAPYSDDSLAPFEMRWQAQAGQHVVKATSVSPAGKMLTAELELSVIPSGPPQLAGERWSDPETWGGEVPAEGDTVEIPMGKTVVIDTDTPALGGLWVKGELIFDDLDATLTSDWIAVNGVLRAGSEGRPHRYLADIILTGNDPQAESPFAAGAGAKYLAVLEGGRLELHGQPTTSWTQLGETAQAGATQITLKEPVDWRVGQHVALASTDFEAGQAETRVITAAEGKVLSLDEPLRHMHYGELQPYGAPDHSWSLDERAEVALLSRNVRIRTDADPERGFGGHVMIFAGGDARLSHVELENMGQRGVLGRYPIHWHRMGDASGNYLKGAAIHHNNNRCVTVHASDNLLIENNTCFETPGHTFFLEDGAERGNVFRHNLGFSTRRPAPEDALLPTDRSHPSTFWISNADNTFVGNVAAGAYSDNGRGFWFTAGSQPTGSSAEMPLHPRYTPIRAFDSNRAHTNYDNLGFEGDFTEELELLAKPYMPRAGGVPEGEPVIPVIDGFVGYRARNRNIWTRANSMRFTNVVAADNGKATFFAFNQTLEDSLVVGKSANKGQPRTEAELAAGRTLPTSEVFRGHSIYDGPSGLRNVHFAGFQGGNAFAIQTNGAATKSTVHYAEGVSFADDTPEANRLDFRPRSHESTMWSSGLIDKDGSLTGQVGARITPVITGIPGTDLQKGSLFNTSPACEKRPDWAAWVCPPDHHAGLLEIQHGIPPKTYEDALLPLRIRRLSDGEEVLEYGTAATKYQAALLVNKAHTYRYYYERPYERFDLRLMFTDPGDAVTVELPAEIVDGYHVSGATELSSLSAVAASEESSFYRGEDYVRIKLVAVAQGSSAKLGSDYTAFERIQLCRHQDCRVSEYP